MAEGRFCILVASTSPMHARMHMLDQFNIEVITHPLFRRVHQLSDVLGASRELPWFDAGAAKELRLHLLARGFPEIDGAEVSRLLALFNSIAGVPA
jgi:hypothetical protein